MPASRSSAGGRHHVSRDAAITTTSGSSRASNSAVAAGSLTSSRSNSTRCGPPSSSASSAACPVRARPCSSSRLAPTRRSTSGRRASESSTRVPRSPRPMTRAVAATGASYHGAVTEGATSVGRATTRSAELFERARRVLVDGVSSPSRGPLNFTPYPLFMTGGEGGEIVDADGNRYVDLMLGFGALIHGHAHPRLVAALREASGRGALLATASEIEVEVAERLVRMVPGAERIRFANTGTEACMAALRLVRGVTGRSKVVKFEGHYHGWSDAVSVGSNPGALAHPDSLGIPDGPLADTIVLPWNDAARVEAALAEHAGEIAAIVTEPVMANMGVIPPADGYLAELRRLADEHHALLWIDETVTG